METQRRRNGFPVKINNTALAREAARILSLIIPALHVTGGPYDAATLIPLDLLITVEVFDRLCLWGAVWEDFEEADPGEDDAAAECDMIEV